MRFLLLISLALVASTSALLKVQGAYDYHERIGIPEAARIKALEEEILAGRQKEARVVGGDVAAVNQFPYFAGLKVELIDIYGTSVCGSSLITADRLVTSAHCWYDGRHQAWQFTVVLGSLMLFSGGTEISTSKVIMHPHYNTVTNENDVAVIYLPVRAPLSESIRPVALPSNTELDETFDKEWSVAAGFGKTSDDQIAIPKDVVIRHVKLRVISVAECQNYYGSIAKTSNICTSGAGGVGVCGGDSGGPLVVNRNGHDVLVGISSYAARVGCERGHPSGYARVTSFYSFINQHL